MAANPGQKIKDGLEALKKSVDQTVDDLLASAAKEHLRTQDGVHKLKGVVVESWAQSNDALEDYINQLTNGGPPLDGNE